MWCVQSIQVGDYMYINVDWETTDLGMHLCCFSVYIFFISVFYRAIICCCQLATYFGLIETELNYFEDFVESFETGIPNYVKCRVFMVSVKSGKNDKKMKAMEKSRNFEIGQ